MKNGWLHGRWPKRKRHVDRRIELITWLIQNCPIGPAPKKTERHGKWYEIIIPIGKDHVAYLSMSEDAIAEIRREEGE
jgi:hypothetical protein